MKYSVFGTGVVGTTIASKLIQNGHEVMMGSRTAANEKGQAWMKAAGTKASLGTFSDAAKYATLIFNCVKGEASLEVMKLAGAENLKGKIIIDISNPLDFSKGMPPSLTVCNTDSVGEQIQRTYPDALVVKTLNTTNCNVMVNPSLVPGDHDLFLSGNDPGAKEKVRQLLQTEFGWKYIIDLGDITTARGTEMLLPIWVRLYGALQTPNFNFHIVK
ncbi:MAG TPA: NAD(P)-binding domain-containing protein [Bacteroidia bacterium]|nr:NAD(P)-binding domain-containing protein [Bacteroidia bacterium]